LESGQFFSLQFLYWETHISSHSIKMKINEKKKSSIDLFACLLIEYMMIPNFIVFCFNFNTKFQEFNLDFGIKKREFNLDTISI
jgi:hypothetical protein